MHDLNLYISGAIVLALVGSVFGTWLFFANRRAKRNIAQARQRSADSRASQATMPTASVSRLTGGGNNSGGVSAKERDKKKKKARKLASKQRRQNRR